VASQCSSWAAGSRPAPWARRVAAGHRAGSLVGEDEQEQVLVGISSAGARPSYPVGREHAPTRAVGLAWERRPGQAVERTARMALQTIGGST
jgi:hypothetical protein